jgi:hypothetical protein
MEASTASLITIIQGDPSILLRIMQHAGLATISPLARVCVFTGQLIAKHRDDIVGALMQSTRDEIALINRLIHRNLSPLMFKYPHIWAEIDRESLRPNTPYICITYWPYGDAPAFFCYADPTQDHIQYTRMIMSQDGLTRQVVARVRQTNHYTQSGQDPDEHEIIIYGRCACLICEPGGLDLGLLGLLGPRPYLGAPLELLAQLAIPDLLNG